ncbi:putative wsc domain-containing protein [Diaporthe ampelina]|uniref:Putative wsc domain-containing protein n=1 Tax=Diaporthe ampelina TaxID=1214573 RepID=A0A0G2HJK6_9PEZI|nr:putative wsc domain-containing protein [Diaporthe ampelina]
MGNAGVNNPVDCSQATQFSIIDGELTRGGQRVSTGPGAAPGRLAVSPTVGSITRAWEIVDEELLWVNASFAGGQARFCVDSATHAVFFTTTGAANEPAGCVPVELTLLFVNDCAGLNPGGDLLPAEETLILPPAVYFPAEAPRDQVCRVTTEYWTIGQFTVAPAPTGTGLNRRQ